FGLEGLVGAVGPGVAVLLLLATPLLYSVPETLLVGELASMHPVEGGYYRWVRRTFNRFWGYWNGWLSWVYSLIDMAIYPVLFLQYLRFFAPGLGRFDAWLLALALIWGATWLNLRGTRVVGTASGWFVAAVLAPFAVLCLGRAARGGGRPVARRPDRTGRDGERVRPVHRAAVGLLAHPARARAGRLAPGRPRAGRWPRNAPQRGPRVRGRLLGVRLAPLRRAARWRRAALHGGPGARVRRAAQAAAPGTPPAGRVPGAAGGPWAGGARRVAAAPA